MKINIANRFPAWLSAFCVVIAGLTACKKSTSSNTTAGPQTITTVLKNASDVTLFYSAMTRVHLDSTFNGPGPFTVFVPTDNAFTVAGITGSSLSALTVDSLKYFLLYHTLAAGLLSTSLPAGPNAKMVTANGDSVFITVNTNGIFINGIQALSHDVQASNGYINAMSAPLFPPRGTLLQTLQADTSFSYMVAAVSRASLGSTDMNGMLASGGPYTLFAPVNYAFRTAGFATIDQINAANSDSLANILLYNMLPGRTFTSDVSSGTFRTTLNDSTILFMSSGATRQIKGSMNTIPANVIAANIMARNGVMYAIDQVLRPKLP
ncbi:MAG: hypothetical protein C5B59_03455 [Bacteroidetes bacterium]|nr:MAG: hypothetical protein C5B59_03455 [Bacteroidota bacterium]